jgi:hypothetical protein
VSGGSHGDAEARWVGVAATRRRVWLEAWWIGGAQGQSHGDTEARQVRSGDDLEVHSVWMPAGWVSTFIPR